MPISIFTSNIGSSNADASIVTRRHDYRALASRLGRRRSGRPAASATPQHRPPRPRADAQTADPRQEMPATIRGERQRKRSPKPNDISRPPLPAAPPAWRSVRYTFT